MATRGFEVSKTEAGFRPLLLRWRPPQMPRRTNAGYRTGCRPMETIVGDKHHCMQEQFLVYSP